MRPVRTHTFDGVRYNIYIHKPISGFCENKPDKTHGLWIFEDIRTRKGLVTIVHEAMHASHPNLSEDTVDRMSKEIGGLLWRMKFRWLPKRK